MIEGNLLIRASAGTGKTFSLATRFIRLMLFDKVSPQKIVALTFSRAAAQEIYTKILDRLRKAASDDAGAEQEHACLLAGLSPEALSQIGGAGIDWSKEGFAALLRKVIDAQHFGSIATLDSFILRIVRNFPLETGFRRAVSVLDPAGEEDALSEALKAILSRPSDSEPFAEVFRRARQGRFSRTCSRALDGMKDREGWWSFMHEHPESRMWDVSSMCKALGVDEHPEKPDLGVLATLGKGDPASGLVDLVASYKGRGNFLRANKTGELVVHFATHPEATGFGWTTAGGKEKHLEYGEDGAAAIRKAIKYLTDVFLRAQLETVRAKILLFALIDAEYDKSTRMAGKLTFRDFTDSARDGSGIALENLQFRFDSEFDHWALDEFQDTSEVQWQCLRNLVESAASSGAGRTVTAVGDLKQSIYTWRGGDDRPFEEMMSWRWFARDGDRVYGRIEDSGASHRYGENIAGFINKVFSYDGLVRAGTISSKRSAATSRWLRDDCWLVHTAAPGADGKARTDDYIKVSEVRPAEGESAADALTAALIRELKPVWEGHRRKGSTETVGILVRTNDDGMALAESLRREGLPAVWEGMSAVCDMPVVRAVLELLWLSEHPQDEFAWKTVDVLFPVRRILFSDAAGAGEVSRAVSASLARHGLARTLKDFCAGLGADDGGLDALSRERLRSLVRLGVEYERRSPSDFGVEGFVRFVTSFERRDLSSSSDEIRILSIHRSKGLTFDRVFVPMFESDKKPIDEPSSRSVLYGRGREWVLPHLPEAVVGLNPETRDALREQRDAALLANIRMYYVAMTRARKAMYVMFPDEQHSCLLFRDVLKAAVCDTPGTVPSGEMGTVPIYEVGTVPKFERQPTTVPALHKWTFSAAEPKIERSSPSGMVHVVARTGGHVVVETSMFGEGYGGAAKRGVELHAKYQDIEWADENVLEALPRGFRAAFRRIDDSMTVWREKSYELFRAGRWESGQFDRVVFSGTGKDRTATIYDFKTNTPGEGESVVSFEERMRLQYAGQMSAYRQALSALTGIDDGKIEAVILLEATGAEIPIF